MATSTKSDRAKAKATSKALRDWKGWCLDEAAHVGPVVFIGKKSNAWRTVVEVSLPAGY